MEPSFRRDPIPACVFQCASCRTLVGDSTAFMGVAGVNGASLIVLQCRSSVSQLLLPNAP